MIEAPMLLFLAWLLGEESGAISPPRRPPAGGKARVEDIPDIGAWPRAVPKNGEQKPRQTGGSDVAAWRRSRFQAAKDFLSLDDRSIEALTKMVEDGALEHEVFGIDAIALSVVAHWDIETASGTAEYNYNVGGIAALPGQSYFQSTDVQSNRPTAFCAYPNLTEGIADYFGFLSYARYADALVALLMLPTDPTWFSELGWAGYYGMDPVAAEKLWSERRALVAADVE